MITLKDKCDAIKHNESIST